MRVSLGSRVAGAATRTGSHICNPTPQPRLAVRLPQLELYPSPELHHRNERVPLDQAIVQLPVSPSGQPDASGSKLVSLHLAYPLLR